MRGSIIFFHNVVQIMVVTRRNEKWMSRISLIFFSEFYEALRVRLLFVNTRDGDGFHKKFTII